VQVLAHLLPLLSETVPHPVSTIARFQIPLVKPDMQFYSIRLSFQRIHAFAHERLAVVTESRCNPKSW
jgi:hypothetical protein